MRARRELAATGTNQKVHVEQKIDADAARGKSEMKTIKAEKNVKGVDNEGIANLSPKKRKVVTSRHH